MQERKTHLFFTHLEYFKSSFVALKYSWALFIIMSEELKVSFYLRHKEVKKDGTAPIMGRTSIGKQMAQFSAKLSVPMGY